MYERPVIDFSNIPKELIVYIMALIPIVGRAAILYGVSAGISPAVVLALGVAGNLTPVVPLLLFLEPVSRRLAERIAFFKRFFDWLFEHTRKRHSHHMDRYGVVGIFIVTAMPASGMGPWSGCLLAFLFGAHFWQSLAAITAGTVVASTLLLAGSLGLAAFSNFSSPLVTVIILLILAVLAIMIWRNQRNGGEEEK